MGAGSVGSANSQVKSRSFACVVGAVAAMDWLISGTLPASAEDKCVGDLPAAVVRSAVTRHPGAEIAHVRVEDVGPVPGAVHPPPHDPRGRPVAAPPARRDVLGQAVVARLAQVAGTRDAAVQGAD